MAVAIFDGADPGRDALHDRRAAFTMACAVLLGAVLVSLRIDAGSRRLRWAVRTADA